MRALVTGATGNVGAHVVRELREHGVEPRAFVRDREKAARMLGDDVELAVGTSPTATRSSGRSTESRGSSWRAPTSASQVEYECAAIDAAQAAGVRRIVKLSGPRAAVDSWLLFERWHGEIERHLFASGVPWVVLRPSAYMTNLLGSADAVSAHRQAVRAGRSGPDHATWTRATSPRLPPRRLQPLDTRTRRTRSPGPRRSRTTRSRRSCRRRPAGRSSSSTSPTRPAREAMREAGLPPMIADSIVDVFVTQQAREHGAAPPTPCAR